ncbi:MAG: HlyD family efflux transporter periplasmic adaptor subunit [Lachnospiraceae bacterium]|nr:HlyD family efflux transporter periplasmic adaptor subunit [Lachnospiraceae bacterium]
MTDTKEQDLDALAEEMMKETPGKKKKKKKKWIAIILVVVLVIGVLVVKNMGGNGEQLPMVQTKPLAKGAIMQTLSLNGPISGTDSVEVVSNLHAEIQEILVKEGDKVEEGQVLARLDSSELERQITIAENEYNLAKATYQEKLRENAVYTQKASAACETAQTALNRVQALYDSGNASLVELEAAKTTLSDAIRERDSVAGCESFALQAENSRLSLEQKQEQLKDTEIISQISGTVVRVNSKVGRFADKTENDRPMFEIENLEKLEMEIPVSEYYIGEIKLGQKVIITADILNGESVEGTVTAISPTGEVKSASSTERVIPITIQISDTSSALIAGINAKASIILDEAENTFIVQSSDVVQRADGSLAVATVENGGIKWIPVLCGIESDFEVEIIPVEEGSIVEGMQIVSNPNGNMAEGMLVSVITTE